MSFSHQGSRIFGKGLICLCILLSSILLAEHSLACAPEIGPKISDSRPNGQKLQYFTMRYRRHRLGQPPPVWRRNFSVIELDACSAEERQNIKLVIEDAPEGASLALTQAAKKLSLKQYQLRYEIDPKKLEQKRFKLLLMRDGQPIKSMIVHLTIEISWHGKFMPGAHFTLYRPDGANADKQNWTGVTLEYIMSAWILKNDRRGPSHGRAYLSTSLLSSEKREELTLIYNIGTQLSFERHASRDYLIPVFGLELGGIYGPHEQRFLHSFQVTPQGGLILFARESMFVILSAGYVVPLSSTLEAQRGWRANAGLHFTLW